MGPDRPRGAPRRGPRHRRAGPDRAGIGGGAAPGVPRPPGRQGPEDRLDWRTEIVLRSRPEALVEAVEILIARPDAVRSILLHPGYTDPATVGGFLDK